MTVHSILRKHLFIERGDAEVVRKPASLTPTDKRALLSSLQLPLPQGTSSLLSASAPQRTETEPTKDWYDSAGRGLPSLAANSLVKLVTAHAKMKSRNLATIVLSSCKSFTGRINHRLLTALATKWFSPIRSSTKLLLPFLDLSRGGSRRRLFTVLVRKWRQLRFC